MRVCVNHFTNGVSSNDCISSRVYQLTHTIFMNCS